jgi:single-strand DNA-binding protein
MLNLTAHGNLGRDPELREAGSSQVASFSIACRTGQDETTWVNCAVWGKRADTVMKFFKKGSKVTVVGSGKLRTYQKKDGTEGQALELNVNDFTLPAREAVADNSIDI